MCGAFGLIWTKVLPSALKGGMEIVMYSYIYRNYRIRILDPYFPDDSLWTSIICLFGVDFLYYWAHRATHEISILWGTHIVHHSSERYNLATALRQSVFQRYIGWVMDLPLAFFMPPRTYHMHRHFNVIYQFWVHTSTIKSIGRPLEFIMNTPSHHRVHHARNPRYIDKNYAGVFIIWDRMFGTFEPESEEAVYGLVHPLISFNPIWTQIHYYVELWHKFRATPGVMNKMLCLVKGPGWSPNKPQYRLGDINDLPAIDYDEDEDVKEKDGANIINNNNKTKKSTTVKTATKTNTKTSPPRALAPPRNDLRTREGLGGGDLPMRWRAYVLLQYAITTALVLGTIELNRSDVFPTHMMAILGIFYIASFTSFGTIFNNGTFAFHFELVRLLLYLLFDSYFWTSPMASSLALPTLVSDMCLVIRILVAISALWISLMYASGPMYMAKKGKLSKKGTAIESNIATVTTTTTKKKRN
eukprot:TRINITY_DN5051_c0_g1_i2.p1 TRINITY_DN5051_c0_g1~~TRINITY_DN5051_c0_g1_i2.p1  ORF type:complete len:535 (-),score=89.24 TRINITY_DN5051_c0_g1_i2:29-1444(-)